MTSDVAIVGAGVVGLSAAVHLAERGAGRIVVYEREGIGAGASGVQTGGVRQQWSSRLNCAMARESLGFYTQLNDRLQPRVDPRFRACGYLFVAHEPSTLERLRGDVALQNGAGVPSRTCSRAARPPNSYRISAPTTCSGRASAPRTASSTGRREWSRRSRRRLGASASSSSVAR